MWQTYITNKFVYTCLCTVVYILNLPSVVDWSSPRIWSFLFSCFRGVVPYCITWEKTHQNEPNCTSTKQNTETSSHLFRIVQGGGWCLHPVIETPSHHFFFIFIFFEFLLLTRGEAHSGWSSRPSSMSPFLLAIASACERSLNVTKPKPRGSPESRSVITRASSTSPCWMKKFLRPSLINIIIGTSCQTQDAGVLFFIF